MNHSPEITDFPKPAEPEHNWRPGWSETESGKWRNAQPGLRRAASGLQICSPNAASCGISDQTEQDKARDVP